METIDTANDIDGVVIPTVKGHPMLFRQTHILVPRDEVLCAMGCGASGADEVG